jgi:hypothetical protein
MGGLGILSYKTVAPHAYAAASEAADTTLAPILTPGSLLDSTQLITQHQRCQEIFAGNREALLGSLNPEQAKAVVEASSKLSSFVHIESHEDVRTYSRVHISYRRQPKLNMSALAPYRFPAKTS